MEPDTTRKGRFSCLRCNGDGVLQHYALCIRESDHFHFGLLDKIRPTHDSQTVWFSYSRVTVSVCSNEVLSLDERPCRYIAKSRQMSSEEFPIFFNTNITEIPERKNELDIILEWRLARTRIEPRYKN